LFGSLYFTEGLFTAVAFVLIPVYFVERGLTIEIATFAIGIAMIPSTLKFFQGGIVDYFQQYGKKIFILLGGVLNALAFILMGIVDPGISLLPFILISFMGVIGFVFLDVSADAWAIEISTDNDRGKINGSMFTGYYSGMAVGAASLGVIASYYGYNIAFFIVGVIVFFIILLPLIIHEDIEVGKRIQLSSLLLGEFKKRNTQIASLFAVFIIINRGMLFVLIPLYMNINLHLGIAQIGLIITIFPIASAIGSMSGGILSDIWGRKSTIYVFIGGSIISSAALIFALNWQILAIIYGVIGFLQGGYAASGLAMLMDITNPHIGATQFSIFASLGNAGMTIGETVSGSLAAMLGFARTFLYSAWIFGPALLILHFIKLKRIGEKT
jgi:MFS family permease